MRLINSIQPNRIKTSHRRRGSLYVSVMGVTMIVSMLGLSAMLAARINLKGAINSTSKEKAQQLAFSGAEYGLHRINMNPNWRSTYTHNIEITPYSLGDGTVSFKLVDADGNLSNNTTDSVRLVGIGRVGSITYSESVLLMPAGTGLTCLETAFHCNGSISLGMSVTLTTNQIASSNGSLSAVSTGSAFDGDVEAVSTISGTINGSTTPGVASRAMPGSDAFEYYKTVGTWIEITSLPLDGSGNPIIEKATLSSTINPFGTSTNLEGIYVIDCQGEKLTIQNSRIEGTIVILNPGESTAIRENIYWTTAVANYPALLVEGNIELRTSIVGLSETTLATNFNPTGLPFEGEADTDTVDDYPSEIIGLVYVSGDLNFPADSLDSKITGCVVTGTCQEDSNWEVNYYNTYLDYAPPGFAVGPEMTMIPGTRRREQ